MSRARLTWVILACGALGAAVGCAPPPPSEQAVLHYLRSARWKGPVRRAWPEGQAYLNAIMRHYAAMQKELTRLNALTTPESLWPKDDPGWQDRPALEAHVTELNALLDSSGAHKQTREAEFEALRQAVEQVPASLKLTPPERTTEFVSQVWDALAGGPDALRYAVEQAEATVQRRLSLYRQVLDSAADFDSARPGLYVQPAERQEQLETAYDALATALAEKRESFMRTAQQRLADLAAAIKQVDKRRQRFDYELLVNEEKYLRDSLEQIPKDLRALADALERQRKTLEKSAHAAPAEGKTQMQVQLAFRQRRVTALRAQADELAARARQLLAAARS